MPFLTPTQHATLALLCETLVPPLSPDDGDDAPLFALSARAAANGDGLHTLLEIALERVSSTEQKAQLAQFLTALEVAPVNGAMIGVWQPFSRMDAVARERLLHAWATSPLELARRAFNSVKRLALFLFYGATNANDTPNPAWASFNYPMPPSNQSSEAQARPIRPLVVDGPQTLDADVLIIGSGAGGGVAAGELSAAGLSVLVIEKGEYMSDADFHGREVEANERLYEKYGALATADLSMVILAGSVLGGGTTINWAGSLRTPDVVLREWEQHYGFDGASGPDFQRSLDAVSARMFVNTQECAPNGNTAMFTRGLDQLGLNTTLIPRNVKGCEDCGFCNFGCAFGAKMGTVKTYLRDAHERGARILVRAKVERINHSGGVAVGAQVQAQGSDGRVHAVSVRAKVVIVAGGAINTPALLLRSGLTNRNIGGNLRLHPTTVTSAVFDEPIRMWQGAPMTRLTADYANLDGDGYGVRLMNAPGHPGIFALVFPWVTARQHRRSMQDIERTANIITITRDKYGGRVSVDQRGDPIIHYTLHPHDARHMMVGVQAALRIHRAAGARMVTAPHNAALTYRTDRGGDFENYLARVAAAGLKANAFALFSAHQMSSCRIASNPALGALTPDGETYEVKNLFVVDASALPTCSGVNPMLTILATAHFLAQRIKARLAVGGG
jgi:choline dehydrogenase-like flavoprotein